MEIIGRVTADAKVTTTKNDKQVVNFTIAINDSYKPKGSTEVKKVTTFVQCSYWLTTSISQHLTKGTLVELFGRMGVAVYSSLDGAAKAALTFHVNSIKLHGSGKAEKYAVQNAEKKQVSQITDDLPF